MEIGKHLQIFRQKWNLWQNNQLPVHFESLHSYNLYKKKETRKYSAKSNISEFRQKRNQRQKNHQSTCIPIPGI